MVAVSLPEWLLKIGTKMASEYGVFDGGLSRSSEMSVAELANSTLEVPNHVLVNEYKKGGGIMVGFFFFCLSQQSQLEFKASHRWPTLQASFWDPQFAELFGNGLLPKQTQNGRRKWRNCKEYGTCILFGAATKKSSDCKRHSVHRLSAFYRIQRQGHFGRQNSKLGVIWFYKRDRTGKKGQNESHYSSCKQGAEECHQALTV